MINPRLAKYLNKLPKGFLRFVIEKITDGILKKYVTMHVEGKENLDLVKGPVIYVCNHLSNTDGLLMHKFLKGRDVTFVTGIKLFENKTTELIMIVAKKIPLKPNSADKGAITKIVKTIKAGGSVFIYPEGTRSRTASLNEAKKGISLIVKLANVPIIPIGMTGSEILMPINDNADMAAESFHKADININVGKPFNLPEKNEGESKSDYDCRAVEFVMRNIASLLPVSYRGVYK
ncbi:MAG TPA: lysophospholipid acyltransferase family protein [Clostridiaceae bacterium]